MYFDYLNVLVFSAVGLVFVFANILIASIIRPKRTNPEGLETYECGEEAIGDGLDSRSTSVITRSPSST